MCMVKSRGMPRLVKLESVATMVLQYVQYWCNAADVFLYLISDRSPGALAGRVSAWRIAIRHNTRLGSSLLWKAIDCRQTHLCWKMAHSRGFLYGKCKRQPHVRYAGSNRIDAPTGATQ